jgi:hypothetical protein
MNRRTRFLALSRVSGSALSPPGHQAFVAFHTEDTLRRSRVAKILNLALAIATFEARSAKRLVTGEDREVFDLVSARAAAIGTIIADQGAISKHQQVGIGIEEGATCMTTKTVNVPSVSGYKRDRC